MTIEETKTNEDVQFTPVPLSLDEALISDGTLVQPKTAKRSRSGARSPRSGRALKPRHHPPNMTSVITFEESKLLKKQIPVGNVQFEYGHMIGEMIDSTDLYRSGDHEGLRTRLAEEGYIFIRGAIDYEKTKKCRTKILTHLAAKDAFVEDTDMNDAYIRIKSDSGWTVDAETGGFVADREPDSAIDGWKSIGWSPEVRAVYAGDDLHALYRFLWGPMRTESTDGYNMLSEVTWLRAKGKGEVTAEHADYYYFKQNTDVYENNRHPYVARDGEVHNDMNGLSTDMKTHIQCDLCMKMFERKIQKPSAVKHKKENDGEWHCNQCARQPFPLYTTWISLGEYDSVNSSLCVLPRSQHLKEFDKPLRGDLLPADYTGLCKNKWGWHRGEIGMGDIILFNVKTVHGASKNTTDKYRLSIDTRVSAHWFRPDSLYNSASEDIDRIDEINKTAPPCLEAIVLPHPCIDNSTRITGGYQECQDFSYQPVITTSQAAPTVLDKAFLEELEVKKKNTEKENSGKKKSRKAMGMGMGMGMGGKNTVQPEGDGIACLESDSEDEEDIVAVKRRRKAM